MASRELARLAHVDQERPTSLQHRVQLGGIDLTVSVALSQPEHGFLPLLT